MPQKWQMVIVTIKHTFDREVEYIIEKNAQWTGNKWHIYDDGTWWELPDNDEVIAWLFLTPYKPK